MIICRTPLRISFFGGGTDYPAWYRENGGGVLGTTINKYSYITLRYLPPFFNYKYKIRYYKNEEVSSVDQIQHPSVRECLRYLKINEGIELVHTADLPAQSGLGSSSTFTVGLLNALYALKTSMVTKRQLALEAIKIEQDIIGEAVGSQDQTAASFGGLNYISFDSQRTFEVSPIIIPSARTNALQESLILVFTGFARTASEFAAAQIKLIKDRTRELKLMTDLCAEALDVLCNVNLSLDEFGRLLGLQWDLKKSLSSLVSNEDLDRIYSLALANGALGGKLLGAGGGGFMLFYVPKNEQSRCKEALKDFLTVPFLFESTGSKIVYYSHS